MAFLGRFASEQEVYQAIAKQSGWHLKMAGKVDAVDAKFFSQKTVNHVDGRQIQYLDEINHTQKAKLSGNTAITLSPSISKKLGK